MRPRCSGILTILTVWLLIARLCPGKASVTGGSLASSTTMISTRSAKLQHFTSRVRIVRIRENPDGSGSE